jgi:recombination protein RecR
VKTKVRRCSCCGNVTEADPCRICAASTRDRSIVCVVEGPSDVVALERTGEFRGTYHVLNGLLRPLDGVGPDALNLASLVRRIGTEPITEVVVATNPSVEGEATAVYIRNILGVVGVKVSRIASGIPIGGELEYADRATLGRALTGRQTMS